MIGRVIWVVGWDGRSQPIYRYKDERDLPEWQQKRPSDEEIAAART